MSEPIDLIITAAGLDKLVDAEQGNTDPIEVVEIGLTEQVFDPAPTLEAIPGEFKRIASVAGQSVSANVIHMTAQDPSAEVYDLRGIGLYLADGTLFASYGQDGPLFRKVSISDFLLAFDVRFSGDVAGFIQFGDASFLYPPATETVKGVARIATQARVDAAEDGGDDGETIVTPKTLRSRIASLWNSITDLVGAEATARTNADNAITAIEIVGAGLATGGGNLTASRTISVTAASGADIDAGTAANKAVTPASLHATTRTLATNGRIVRPDGLIEQWGYVSGSYSTETTIPVTFPAAFPNQLLNVICDTEVASATNAADFFIQAIRSSFSLGGFSAQAQSLSGSSGAISGFSYRAIGR